MVRVRVCVWKDSLSPVVLRVDHVVTVNVVFLVVLIMDRLVVLMVTSVLIILCFCVTVVAVVVDVDAGIFGCFVFSLVVPLGLLLSGLGHFVSFTWFVFGSSRFGYGWKCFVV